MTINNFNNYNISPEILAVLNQIKSDVELKGYLETSANKEGKLVNYFGISDETYCAVLDVLDKPYW